MAWPKTCLCQCCIEHIAAAAGVTDGHADFAGNDLNEERTPVEAGLTWTIGKKRRDACDFLGGEVGSVPGPLCDHSDHAVHG